MRLLRLALMPLLRAWLRYKFWRYRQTPEFEAWRNEGDLRAAQYRYSWEYYLRLAEEVTRADQA